MDKKNYFAHFNIVVDGSYVQWTFPVVVCYIFTNFSTDQIVLDKNKITMDKKKQSHIISLAKK